MRFQRGASWLAALAASAALGSPARARDDPLLAGAAFNFVHSAIGGWSDTGVTLEHALIVSRAQVGPAWRRGPDTAPLAVMQGKDQVIMPGVPSCLKPACPSA